MPPVYFDSGSGELMDVPGPEFSRSLSQNNIFPLGELLVSKEMPFKCNDFAHRPLSEWSEQELIKIGSLVVQELEDMDPPHQFTMTVAERLRTLGLFPDPYRLFYKAKPFGDFSTFKQKIGIEAANLNHRNDRNLQYDNLSLDELAELLRVRFHSLLIEHNDMRRERPLRQSILVEMNRMDLGPGIKYIQKRFGSVRALNERLGFPDITTWDDHDYIAYGATLLRVNGPDSLNSHNLDLLAKNNYGPSYDTVVSKMRWEDFKSLAQAEYKSRLTLEDIHREKVLEYQRSRNFRSDAFGEPSFDEMAMHRALHLITQRYLGTNAPELPQRINPQTLMYIIKKIVAAVKDVTIADVEATAVQMDLFDDLWPKRDPHNLRRPLRLPLINNYTNG